jgi:hypothetical protein
MPLLRLVRCLCLECLSLEKPSLLGYQKLFLLSDSSVTRFSELSNEEDDDDKGRNREQKLPIINERYN